ncbi:MAG: inorganic phosphate transporter [Chloroflexi bacterium]|nr:inorganic phosphate transporter [Chloroflexota bacterium]
MATVISSQALPPRLALGLTALAEMSGPFVLGVAVARTFGQGLLDTAHVSVLMIAAALVSAVVWNIITWFFGIPSSSSHALVGGLIGSVWAGAGLAYVQPAGILKVILALFLSPLLGLLVGFLLTRLIFYLARNANNRINVFFKNAQILTALSLGISHGANDSPKAMGIITLGLLLDGGLQDFTIPVWVMLACAGAMALGTSIGGWRLIKRLGLRFYKIRPIHGFGTQVSAALVVFGASLLGGPVSTTQVVSSAIMGVGAGERIKKVRWMESYDILIAWGLTIPASMLLSAGCYWLLQLVFSP